MPVSLAPGNSGGAGDGNPGGGNPGNAGNNPVNGGGANPNGSGGGADNGGNPGDAFAGLSPENKELVTKRGWKTHDDVIKSYRELETKFSGRDPTKTSNFGLGDYAFKAPANADKIGYSKENAEAFRQFAHKNNLSPEAAGAVHDWFITSQVEGTQKAQAAAQEAMNTKLTAATDQLTKAWGADNTPGFKRNVEMAYRTIRELGITDALVESGALVKSKDGKLDVVNATLVAALAKVGGAMYAEDSMYGSSSGSKNPFAVGTAEENSGEAGKILREDPDKAEALIRAAGPKAMSMYQHWLNGRRK